MAESRFDDVLHSLPEGGAALLVVRCGVQPALAASEMVDFAVAVGRLRKRTLLVNLDPVPPGLDQALGVRREAGITQALRGEVKITAIAELLYEQGFQYLPAGPDSAAFADIARGQGLRHLVEMARRGGGTLLLYVAEEALKVGPGGVTPTEDLTLDGFVTLGETSEDRLLDLPYPHLGHIGVVAEVPDGGEVSGPGWTTTRRRSESRSKKRASFAQIAAIWITTGALVWITFQGLNGWPAFQTPVSTTADTAAGESVAQMLALPSSGPERAVSAVDAGSTRGSGQANTPADSAAEVRPARERPYSVLLASYVRWADALAHVEALESEASSLFFVAPTPLRGRLYYRVFAGAAEDGIQAERLMSELVEGGQKAEERRWDMRRVRLAYRLGDYPTISEARSEQQRLRLAGVPAYVLFLDGPAGGVYRVYSGAFESETAGAELGSHLVEAGQQAVLESRRGEVP